jgi:hypothetical protein
MIRNALAVREAEDGEMPEDVRQYHANPVGNLEEQPAVSVSIRMLRSIIQYCKTFTQIQGGTESVILVFSTSAAPVAPSFVKT